MKTDDLIGLLAQDLATPPRRPHAVLARWLPVAAAAAALLLVLTLGLRAGLPSAPVLGVTAQKWLFGAAIAAAAGVAALRLSRPDAPQRGAVAAAGAGLLAIAAAFALDGGGRGFADVLVLGGLKCLVVVPLLALPVGAAFMAALREGAPASPALAGGLAGGAAGGIAILIYALHCTEDGAAFVAVWYMAAALLCAGMGAAAGARLLRW
jgi:hypothetical protein